MFFTLCILVDFPIHIVTISMGLPIVYFKGSENYAAFHLGLQCLPKYPFRGFQYTKGYYLAISQLPGKENSISTFVDIFAIKHKEVIFKLQAV